MVIGVSFASDCLKEWHKFFEQPLGKVKEKKILGYLQHSIENYSNHDNVKLIFFLLTKVLGKVVWFIKFVRKYIPWGKLFHLLIKHYSYSKQIFSSMR